MDYQFLVISNPEDKTDWWRVNNQNAPKQTDWRIDMIQSDCI